MEEVSVASSSELPSQSRTPEQDSPLCVSADQQPCSLDAEPLPGPGTPSSCSPSSSHPSGLPQLDSPLGSAVSALQSKVKALSERRALGWDREDGGQTVALLPTGSGRPQAPKRASHPVLGSAATGKWLSSSSDEEAEPQGRFYRANFPSPADIEGQGEVGVEDGCEDSPIVCPASLSRELGVGASQESLSDVSSCVPEESPIFKSRTPPKGFSKANRPETLLLNKDALAAGDRSPSSQAVELGGQKKAWMVGPQRVRREIQRYDSLEGHLGRYVPADAELEDPLGGVWRADSWESVCSSGSSLSLAERVEMNRGLLKQMLSRPKTKEPEGKHRAEDPAEGNSRGSVALNDSDWDSGISLQDSEPSQRAFVLSEDLPLSPRHEQAKRLLERARMKARSCPLKADHTILPIQRDCPEPSSRVAAPLRRAPLMGKEGVAVVSGNLSDSSSGDSVCGPRRRHGQSPTRVRFEDESEKDAEVRYLERLRQRRRAGERAQGLLVSKPNLSSYVNGRKDSDTSTASEASQALEGAPLWDKKSRRTQERATMNGSTYNKAAAQEAANRKCNSCGSVLEGTTAVPSSDCQTTQRACDGEAEAKAVPVWVSPSSPDRTVCIEGIKETYIGEVYCTAEHVGGNGAGERASAAGKLKRRSRKGDSRQEAGLSPYARTGAAGCYQETNSRSRCSGAELRAKGELPPNPYASERLGCRPAAPAANGTLMALSAEVSTHLNGKNTPSTPLPIKSALKSGPRNRPNGQRVVKLQPSPEYHVVHPGSLKDSSSLGPCLSSGTPVEQPSEPEMVQQCLEEQQGVALSYGQENPVLLTPCPPGLPISTTKETGDNGELRHETDSVCSGPANHCVSESRLRGPIRAEHLSAEHPCPELTHVGESHKRVVFEGIDEREGKPRLSLRRFFSAIGLNSLGKHSKERSSSMEQLSLPPKSSPASSSPPNRHYGQLKKAPSLQSLRMGSPLSQLRKASSVQSLQIPKRKGDRSSAYTPGEQPSSPAYRGLQRALSVEDVGSPSAVRSVGRVVQAFPDGTLLLELRRPPDGPFGFLISRGKGRPDSGVYVEEMGDRCTQKLYAGLLGVGDEILEVNGEKVAGLTLDQVTRIMTQDCSTSIRVLRHRRVQH
ncbi:hypothetical protein GJAV_G00079420 [Gymnothorax javanicus]|nr:hypothetical protein GJAV_G00079420 [Gymnothorax javanicus]